MGHVTKKQMGTTNRQEGQELSRSMAASPAAASMASNEELETLERTLSSEGRAAMVGDGTPLTRLASIRSSLEERAGDARFERARTSLERGVPLDHESRSSSVRGPAPEEHDTPTARRNPVNATPQMADLRMLSRSYSVEIGHGDAEHDDDARSPLSEDAGSLSASGELRWLYSWGRNSLMQEEAASTKLPRAASRFESRLVQACATSGWHALCCDEEGTLFGCGANRSGEAVPGCGDEEVPRPQRIEVLPVGVRVGLVACGLSFSACVLSSGQILTWGSNELGQCGLADPAKQATVSTPTLVRGVPRKVSQVAAGDAFVAIRTEVLDVYVWGDAEACCCDQSTEPVWQPKRIDALAGVPVISLAAGACHAIALSKSGSAYAWGRNSHSQCCITPRQDDGGIVVTRPTIVEIADKLVAVAAGRSHSLFAAPSKVHGAGRDHVGQISGIASAEDVGAPGKALPVTAAAGVRLLAAGDAHSLVALESGEIWAVGSNKAGALGVDDPSKSFTQVTLPPPPFKAESGRLQISALEACGDATLAIATLGTTELQREDSLAAIGHPAQRPIDVEEASRVGVGAALGELQSLDRLSTVLSAPNLLSASFLDATGKLDTSALDRCMAPLEEMGAAASEDHRVADRLDRLAKALTAGAKRLGASAASAATADAARAVLCYLRAAAAFVSPKPEWTPRSIAWSASRFAVDLLLGGHEDCRAAVLEALLSDDKDRAFRNVIRRPLKLLVAVAALRSALEGRLPSGPGVDLKDAAKLLDELDAADARHAAGRAAALSTSASAASDEASAATSSEGTTQQGTANTAQRQPTAEEYRRAEQMSQLARQKLVAPASLAKRAMRASAAGLFRDVSIADTFEMGLRGALGLEMLRTASRHRVPRGELSEDFRVPEVDAMGVVVARRIASNPYGDRVIGITLAAPGALLLDFRNWRERGAPMGPESLKRRHSGWCLSSFPFLSSPETKRELCAVEAMRRQGAAGASANLLRAAAANPFAGLGFPLAGTLAGQAAVPYLVVTVPRTNLLDAARNILLSVPDSEFSKELKVVFEGEEGVDEGGVRKEFFSLLVPQLFDPVVGMFIETADRDAVFFNHNCDWYDVEYELGGILVGLAAYNQVVLDIRLPRLAYKKLLDHLTAANDHANGHTNVFTLDDLTEIDRELASGLRKLLAFEPSDAVEDTFCRSFVDDRDGENAIELVPGGADIAVTGGNRRNFVEKLLEHRLFRAVEPQFSRFAKGFARVMQSAMLDRLVEPEELMVMVQGEPNLDFRALEASATYEGWPGEDPTKHPVVQEFWRAVHSLSPQERKKFLMFVTAHTSAPLGGLAKLRPAIKIQRMSANSEQLPTAHTCFNLLLLPDYDPPKKIETKLRLAISECEGFGLK